MSGSQSEERKLYVHAPQMRDYDARPAAGVWWAPYVMFHCGFPNHRSNALNTDAHGVRYTIDSRGRRVSPETLSAVNPEGRPVNLLVGGSTAFGVGASSDSTTVSSLLSRADNAPWINLGHGSWVLFQNLIQLMFVGPKLGKVDRIVLFAGFNELDIFTISTITTLPYGPFYFWRDFFAAMNTKYKDASNEEYVFPGSLDGMLTNLSVGDQRRELFLEYLRTCLSNWSMLSRFHGARTLFCLQPVLHWLDRRCSPEEEELMAERASRYPHEAELFAREADAYRGWYREALESLSIAEGFGFLDANVLFEDARLAGEYLFVDPWHLTDRGSLLVAEAIQGGYSQWTAESSSS